MSVKDVTGVWNVGEFEWTIMGPRAHLARAQWFLTLLELKQQETKSYILVILEDLPVRNLKPAVVKVYDYYQTSDVAVSDYSSPCAEGDDINEL